MVIKLLQRPDNVADSKNGRLTKKNPADYRNPSKPVLQIFIFRRVFELFICNWKQKSEGRNGCNQVIVECRFNVGMVVVNVILCTVPSS